MPYQGRIPAKYPDTNYKYTLEPGSATSPTLSFLNDSNNGLWSPATDNLAISTNGSEKLRVTDTGNVGIGTDNPYTAYKLHVTGTVGIGSGGFSQQLSLGNNSIQSLLLGTGYTNLTLNALGGNVGIGTTNPSSKLSLYSSGTLASFNSTGTYGDIILTNTYGGGTVHYIGCYDASLRFYANSGSVPTMTISGGSPGNVGIGTITPLDNLVVASDNYRGITLRTATAGNRPTVSFLNAGSNTACYIQGNSNSIAFGAFNTDYGGHSEKVIITASGNIGIGTTNPTEKLEIAGNTIPSADATHNLGSPTKRWNNVYTTDLQLSNEGSQNDVDGTWGQYTIQEGEDDLFLLNRRNGKKYKFVLQEVG